MLFWVVLWLVVGVASGFEVLRLSGLADSAVDSGHALETAGGALRTLRDVPVIGDTTADLGQQVSRTAEGIVSNGIEAKGRVRVLGLLLGVAVALGPVGPVLLFYVPVRLAWRREVKDVASALGRDRPASAQLVRHLATRAVANLSFAELSRVTDDPHADLATGRHRELAQAELRRLGLDPGAVA